MRTIYSSDHLRVFQSALFQTNATLLRGAHFQLLVDPNWLPEEIQFLRKRTAETRSRNLLLFTHSDYDHILGYGAFPDWETIASRAFVDNPKAAEQVEQILQFDDDYYIERDYKIVYPTIDHAISGDGTTLELDGETLHFFQAPGHNADGLLTLCARNRVLLAGDYGCAVEFPYLYHSLADYRTTLDKIEALLRENRFDVLVPGHGSVAESPQEVHHRLAESRAYLDELEAHVRTGAPFDEERLFRRYRFPRLMRRFHAANVDLVRRELLK